MSVMHLKPSASSESSLAALFTRRRCYYCGIVLTATAPFVLWMGFGESVALHPGCVVELTIRLLHDVHEIESTTHTSVTTPPAPPSPAEQLAALRARLAARTQGGGER